MSGMKKCAKSVLFAFNVVFTLSGLAAVASGIWMIFDPGNYDRFLGNYKFLYPASILIASGLFVLIVAFCGCFGAVKENKCLLGTYFTMLLLTFCAMIAAGVLGFLFQGKVLNEIKSSSLDIIKNKYGTGDKDIDYTVDLVQQKLECCGAIAPIDYMTSKWKSAQVDKREVPESCCSIPSKCVVSVHTTSSLVYKKGCNDKLVALTVKNLTILGGIGCGLACIQLLGMCFSCCLFFAIER